MTARTLRALVAESAGAREVRGEGADSPLTSLETDSRRVTPGALFVALRGERSDGHDFVAQAFASGAIAAVVQTPIDVAVPPGGAIALVDDTRRALSTIAAAFYGDPSKAMRVAGVTGTNGKTTTTQMIAGILEAAGVPCGVVGTVGARFGEQRRPLRNTTPLAHDLHALLAHMRDDGARAVAMEVSSHGLELDRVNDVRFFVGAFTNITRDHLDFHGTMEAYAHAKRRLFELAERCVFNENDPYGATWAHEFRIRKPTLTYALTGEADLVPSDVAMRPDGSNFTLDGTRFDVRLAGRFNVANALCAVACARMLDVSDADAARGLATVERVPGRMEHIAGGDIDVVVDYAHTPDSLENVLGTLRETTRGGLAVVFGCGGDRDRGKREQMGEIAAGLADRIYITNDNPRTEDPQAIADAIERGVGAYPHVVELDRARAIERAVADASPGDTLLLAGKGHETYQLVGDRVLPFDDADVARAALARRKARA